MASERQLKRTIKTQAAHIAKLYNELGARDSSIADKLKIIDSFIEREGLRVKYLHEVEANLVKAVPMILFCPACQARHVDEGAWEERPHRTHLCAACGFMWRPANRATVGVQFLPEPPPQEANTCEKASPFQDKDWFKLRAKTAEMEKEFRALGEQGLLPNLTIYERFSAEMKKS